MKYVWIGLAVVAACQPPSPREATPTYTQHVEPILRRHCVGCHRSEGIAPFALETYAETKAHAEHLVQVVASRTMPPWNVDNSGACHTFKNARWLREDEIEIFTRWARAGAPKGPEVPVPLLFPAGPTLDRVDVTLDPGLAYTPPADQEDNYRCFVVDPSLDAPKYLTGYHVRPGSKKLVHHVLLFAPVGTAATAKAEALDAAEDGLGYTCFGGPKVDADVVAGWAPGTPPTLYPEGTGVRLRAGTKFVMQIHYNTVQAIEADRTLIDLRLDASVGKQAFITPLADTDMLLPPGLTSAETSVSSPLSELPKSGVTVHAVFPHMHTLGRHLKLEQITAEGTTCLANVDRWNFAWQQFYFYEQPVHIPWNATGALKLTCTFDTSSRRELVRWGEGTLDEMCLVYLYVTP